MTRELIFRGLGFTSITFATLNIGEYEKEHSVDYFIFGHYHAHVDMPTPSGSRLLVLKDWISSSPYIVFDGESVSVVK